MHKFHCQKLHIDARLLGTEKKTHTFSIFIIRFWPWIVVEMFDLKLFIKPLQCKIFAILDIIHTAWSMRDPLRENTENIVFSPHIHHGVIYWTDHFNLWLENTFMCSQIKQMWLFNSNNYDEIFRKTKKLKLLQHNEVGFHLNEIIRTLWIVWETNF